MEHNKIIEYNWLEKYLSHELTKREETLFEEHLLYCDTCLTELENLKISLKTIKEAIPFEKGSDDQTDTLRRPFQIPSFIYQIAAVLLVVIGFAIVIFYLSGNTEEKTHPVAKKNVPVNKIIAPGDSDIHRPKSTTANIEIAENYKPNPVFENELKNTFRSNDLTNVAPSINAEFKTGEVINFQWNSSNDSLLVVILNNQGKELVAQKSLSSYTYKCTKPGLYYWQLQSETEALFTGKFKVKNP
jgi:hypothetical protein